VVRQHEQTGMAEGAGKPRSQYPSHYTYWGNALKPPLPAH